MIQIQRPLIMILYCMLFPMIYTWPDFFIVDMMTVISIVFTNNIWYSVTIKTTTFFSIAFVYWFISLQIFNSNWIFICWKSIIVCLCSFNSISCSLSSSSIFLLWPFSPLYRSSDSYAKTLEKEKKNEKWALQYFYYQNKYLDKNRIRKKWQC